MEHAPILTVEHLKVSFFLPEGELRAVDGLSYTLNRGEVLGIVGESGSGKSVQAYSLLGLLRPPGTVIGGSAKLEERNLIGLPEKDLRPLRGQRVSMVFQNPMHSLCPVYSVGRQMMEAGLCHGRPRAEVRRRAIELLGLVGIPEPERFLKRYPHELSGGMCQRVMIAMGLLCEPDILIADEPTTALDVTIQAQILRLLKEIQRNRDMSVLFITHNLGVVAQICDRVAVMYAGRLMEEGPVHLIFEKPLSPYTRALLESIPSLDQKEKLEAIPGAPPNPFRPAKGCPFAPRCKDCMALCREKQPELIEVEPGHRAACWLWEAREEVPHG